RRVSSRWKNRQCRSVHSIIGATENRRFTVFCIFLLVYSILLGQIFGGRTGGVSLRHKLSPTGSQVTSPALDWLICPRRGPGQPRRGSPCLQRSCPPTPSPSPAIARHRAGGDRA